MSSTDFSGSGAPAHDDASNGGDEASRADLEARLAQSQAESDKYRDEFLRARAEADNIRRRAQEDVAKAHRYGQESFASAMLAVKDSLDAALAVETATVESYRQGVELTARQLEAAFEKNSISVLDPAGQKFDPHRHQAISQAESTQEPGTVVSVLQKGYLLHDRVLRPALVVVAKAPDSAPGN